MHSTVAAHGLSSCGARASLSRGTWDLSSPTRDWTHEFCIGKQSLNHWTTREVPGSLFRLIPFKISLCTNISLPAFINLLCWWWCTRLHTPLAMEPVSQSSILMHSHIPLCNAWHKIGTCLLLTLFNSIPLYSMPFSTVLPSLPLFLIFHTHGPSTLNMFTKNHRDGRLWTSPHLQIGTQKSQ